MADPPFPDRFAADLGEVSLELERIGDLADGVSRSLTRAFRGAILDGKSLQSVLAEVARGFADIALKAALKPLGDLAGGLVGSLFSATNPVLQGVAPFAHGGVLAAPAYFPAAGQAGLAREAGPGATVQLPQGSDGRPGAAAVSVTFNVTATDARSFVAAEAEVSAMLLRAVRRGTRGS